MPPRSKSVQRKRFSFASSQASPETPQRNAFDSLGYGLSMPRIHDAGPAKSPHAVTPRAPRPGLAQDAQQWSPLANALAAPPAHAGVSTTTPTPKKRRLLPMADLGEVQSPCATHRPQQAETETSPSIQRSARPAALVGPSPRSITSWASDIAVPKLESPSQSLHADNSQARLITHLPEPFALPWSAKAKVETSDEKKDAKPMTSLWLGDVGLGGGSSDIGAWAAKLSYSPRRSKVRDGGATREDRYVRNGLADLARREIRKLSTEHTLFEAEQLRPWLASRHEAGVTRDAASHLGSPSSKAQAAQPAMGPAGRPRREGVSPMLVLAPLRVVGRDSTLGDEGSVATAPAGIAAGVRPGWSPTRRAPQTQVLLECQVIDVSDQDDEDEAKPEARGDLFVASRTDDQVRDADKSGRPPATRGPPSAPSSTLEQGQRIVVLLSASQAGRASAAETAVRVVLARLGQGGLEVGLTIAAWGPIMTMDLGVAGADRARAKDAIDTLIITRFAVVQ